MNLMHWGVVLHGDFSIQSRNLLTSFQKYIVVMSLWKNLCINPSKILLQRETLILIMINSIINCTY